jgi:hypothetical protein
MNKNNTYPCIDEPSRAPSVISSTSRAQTHHPTHEASTSAAAKQGNGHVTPPATTATGTISTKKFTDTIHGLREAICQLDHNQNIDNAILEDVVHRVDVLKEDFGQRIHEQAQRIHEQAQRVHEQDQRILAIEEMLAHRRSSAN